MADSDTEDNIALRIDSQVVRQLGAELITDPEQALIELIKNAYDADADNCRVEIDTLSTIYLCDDKVIPPDVGRVELDTWKSKQADSTVLSENPPVNILSGRIMVENDGPGVDFDTIRDRWLLISGSIKRAAKGEKKNKTVKDRTPIGDKGIGRLGTMRLGDRIEFISRNEGATGSAKGVAFRWSSFDKVTTLDQVPVHPVEDLPTPNYSTRVAIEGLEEPGRWVADMSKLQASLSRLISPFSDKHEMEVSISVNGAPIELQTLVQDLELHAVARYSFSFNPAGADDTARIELETVVVGDFFGEDWTLGLADDFLTYFNSHYPTYGLSRADTGHSRTRWAYRINRSLDCDQIRGFSNEDGPGQFSGGIYSVSFTALRTDKDEKGVPLSGAMKQLIRKLTGIAIYRNGFGIRINPDWLDLSSGLTSGSSWYALRKGNTVGYVDLDSETNAQLAETSNREGFMDTPAWRQFLLLSQKIRDEINEINEALRRGFGDYTKASSRPPAEKPKTVEHAIATLERQAKYAQRLHSALTQQHGVAVKVSNFTKSLPPDQGSQIASLKSEIEASVETIEKLIAEGRLALSADANTAQKLIEDEFDRLREQVTIAYDFIGAGMAAENFAHEIHPIIERAIGEISSAARIVKNTNSHDDALVHLQSARSYVRLVGKYLSTLDPMLRIYRDIKDTFKVSEFSESYVRDTTERLGRAGIRISLEVDADFSVTLPRGRLMQVFDNIVRNSEYWLAVPAAKKIVSNPQIYIRVADPVILIWDNGLGVRQDLEDRIFQMFVSDKPRDIGRGLGLFITREILTRFGGSIHLGPERNSHGRRFMFEISLKSPTS